MLNIVCYFQVSCASVREASVGHGYSQWGAPTAQTHRQSGERDTEVVLVVTLIHIKRLSIPMYKTSLVVIPVILEDSVAPCSYGSVSPVGRPLWSEGSDEFGVGT